MFDNKSEEEGSS
jgi:hypothetical protein